MAQGGPPSASDRSSGDNLSSDVAGGAAPRDAQGSGPKLATKASLPPTAVSSDVPMLAVPVTEPLITTLLETGLMAKPRWSSLPVVGA